MLGATGLPNTGLLFCGDLKQFKFYLKARDFSTAVLQEGLTGSQKSTNSVLSFALQILLTKTPEIEDLAALSL